MKESKTFAAYRYFLIQSDQISLDDRKQVLAFERKITDGFPDSI